MAPKLTKKHAMIGYAVTKFIVPALKKQAKRKAKASASHAAKSSAGAVKRNPKRVAAVIGSAVGAAGYFATRAAGKRRNTPED